MFVLPERLSSHATSRYAIIVVTTCFSLCPGKSALLQSNYKLQNEKLTKFNIVSFWCKIKMEQDRKQTEIIVL